MPSECYTVYVYTKLGVDSSSHFPFRARTNRQTHATERYTHAGGYTGGVGNYMPRTLSDSRADIS